jgi:nitroreductase
MRTTQSIEVINAIYQRRAIRKYRDRTLEPSRIQRLIDAAIQAPSSMNLQPWAFVVVQGASRLEEYSNRIKAHLLSAPGAVVEHAKHLLADNVNIFHGAPVLIVICATSHEEQAAEDCSLAGQNLMLAAFSSGLGTCPIGFARPWLRLSETKRELGVPEQLVPAFPVVVGYPNESPRGEGRDAPQVLWIGQGV